MVDRWDQEIIPPSISKETNVLCLGEGINLRFAVEWKPGAFSKWLRYSSVMVPAPLPHRALPFQEITPAFVSFESLSGIIV